jgi:hypothetical protein
MLNQNNTAERFNTRDFSYSQVPSLRHLYNLLITSLSRANTPIITSLTAVLAVDDVSFSSKHLVIDVDLRAFTFLVSIFTSLFGLSKAKAYP